MSAAGIADYGLIGDCRTAALVSRAGSVDWLCLPNFSGPSLFAQLLDGAGGSFSIRPRGTFTATRHYVDGTPVLETTFETERGSVKLRDAIVVLDGVTSLQPMRELLRIVEGCSGEVEMEILLDPRPDYARLEPKLHNRRRTGWLYTWRNEALSVGSDAALSCCGAALSGTFVVRAGEKHRFSLAYTADDIAIIPPLGSAADERLERTIAWWRQWLGDFQYQGSHREEVRCSALVLKLLTYALSGAVIAAPTTSLPESIGHDRNFDYRFCWLRDAGLTVQALMGVGFRDDASDFLGWLLHATRLTWPKLQVAYDVYGRQCLAEQELPHFAGYRASGPVRIGNAAYAQLQLDIYGDVVLAAERLVRGGLRLDPVEGRVLAGLGRTVCDEWRKPDSSMWEFRGPRRQFTVSKVMSWLALDRLLTLDGEGHISLGRFADRFRRERDAIAKTIETRGFNPRLNSYTSELDGSQVTGSLLLIGLLGYKQPNDPRMAGTYDLVWRRLSRNGLLYRFEPGYDGVASAEGTFGICTFWAIEYLARRGDIEAAEKMLDHACAFANDLGLFAEEIDAETGEPLGNFPQAFTHVGLINAALAVQKARRER